MSTILVMLDTRRAKVDKTFPIVFRLIHNGIPTTIRTGYSVLKGNWNSKSLTVRKNCSTIPSAGTFNMLLKRRENEMREALVKLESEVSTDNLSVVEIKDLLTKPSVKKVSFIQYANSVINSLFEENRVGTATSYKEAINFVIKNTRHDDLPFAFLNVKLLYKLENKYMSNTSNHFNGLAVYLRSIRAIYNRAIADGIVNTESYPFHRGVHDVGKYRIKTEKTKKRAINKESMMAIEQFAFDTENDICKKHLFYFLFSFYLRGMNFADIAKIKASAINNGTIEYRRSKTKRLFEIKIGNKALAILNYFEYQKKKPGEYIFPIITRTKPEGIKKEIKNNIKATNKYLKKASEELGLNIKLTTYVSRHSWATIADKAGIDRRIISQGLGHSDLRTTDIYIDDIVSGDDLSAADEIITG